MFKQLCADEKLPMADIYILISPSNKEQCAEILKCMAGIDVLNNLDKSDGGNSFKQKKYWLFSLEQVSTAIAFIQSEEYKDFTKLIFFNDALITKNKTTSDIVTFIQRAKNSKCTVVAEIHHNAKLDNLYDALNVKIFFNETPRVLAQQLRVQITSPIINKYSADQDKNKKIISVDGEYFNGQNYKQY